MLYFKFKPVRGHQLLLNSCQHLGAVPPDPTAVIAYEVKLNPPFPMRNPGYRPVIYMRVASPFPL